MNLDERTIRLDKIGLTVGITLSVLWYALLIFSTYYGFWLSFERELLGGLLFGFGVIFFAPSAFIVPGIIMFPFLHFGCRLLHKDFHEKRTRMGDGVVFQGDGSDWLSSPREFENTFCVKCNKWVDFIG